MKIKLQDAPEHLFDPGLWEQFRNQFCSGDAALAAISRPPINGYHLDDDPALPIEPAARRRHAQTTYELGNKLMGSFKRGLISGDLESSGVAFHLAYENGEEEPVIIPGMEWEELWPIFTENRAMRLKVYDPIAHSPMTGGLVHSAKRYEAVRISWDDRRGAGQADLELLLVSWLEKQPQGLSKKQLAKEAREHFGSVTERTFNRAYTHVLKRKRGRPRLKK